MTTSNSRFALGATLLAAAAVVSAANPAQAYEPRYNWVGSVVIVGVTSACSGKWDVGTRVTSAFRPRLQASEDNSAVTFTGFGVGGIFQTTSNTAQLNGAGNYNSYTFGYSHVRPATATGTYKLVQSPATIAPKTTFVTLSGTITNFFANAGCTVTIHGSYTLKP